MLSNPSSARLTRPSNTFVFLSSTRALIKGLPPHCFVPLFLSEVLFLQLYLVVMSYPKRDLCAFYESFVFSFSYVRVVAALKPMVFSAAPARPQVDRGTCKKGGSLTPQVATVAFSSLQSSNINSRTILLSRSCIL